MQRRGGFWLMVAIVISACSSSGPDRDATTTDGPDRSTMSADVSDGSSDELPASSTSVGGSDDGSGEVGPSDGRIALPGLLDESDDALADDDAVRSGALDNGLRYYVRSNDNPGGKADMRLAVRAGSVDEISDETGVAHFVEHMLFNGTERFPENELIDTLRSFGAAFGADVNAYTSYDETVYTLNVPNDDETVELGLTVLEQWLSHATFDEEQVVAERGVVLDEWRVRTQTTDGRLFDVAEELYLTGSPYDGRSPIGDRASIDSMPVSVVRAFYDRWYRPDNAAVVVVGDVDVDETIVAIEQLFGATAKPDAPLPPRSPFTFDIDREPAFGLHADPDQQTVDVEVTLPIPATRGHGTLAARVELLDVMIFDALIRRLERDVAAGSAPFDDIGQGGNSFVDALDAPALYAVTDADRVDDTLLALLDEYERTFRFGFTAEETDLARESIRALFDTRYDGRDSTQDADFADSIVTAYLQDGSYPSIEDQYEVVTTIIDSVTPEALGRRFGARWSNSAPHVVISTPDRLAGEMPSDAEVLAVIAATPTRELEARGSGRELPDVLMATPDQQAPLVVEPVLSQGGNELFDPVRLVYPNGLTVILNSNTIVEAQVFFQAASPGGNSLVDDADVVDALFAADVVTSSGVADFNAAEMDQILAGADTEVGAWIDPYLEHFAGSAATTDVELLFQQLHLYMTQPRVDEIALDQLRSRVGPAIADPASDAQLAGDDALVDLRYADPLRNGGLPTPAELDTLDPDGIGRVWRNRYGDASGWVFVFAGDFDIDAVVELANAYLGTLPGSGTPDTWVDVSSAPPPGAAAADVVAGSGDTATVTMLFTSPLADIDAEVRVTSDVVTELIQARLTSVIREQLGDSYSPAAVTLVTTDPDPVVETYVFVTGSPERIASIAEVVVAELDDLALNGPARREFDNAAAQVEESLNFVDNGTLLQELLDAELHPARDLDDYLLEFDALGSVTVDTVREFIAANISRERYAQVTVVPR